MSYRIPNSIVIGNGKGGVGKTTVAANLAWDAARRGAQVTLLDLDPQANLAAEFGIEEHDAGKSLLAAALLDDQVAVPVETGRTGIRIICGGSELLSLRDVAGAQGGGAIGLAQMIREAVSPILRSREWLIVDTPPSTGSPLGDAALLFGEYLLVPTRQDPRSLNGVGVLFDRLVALASMHPEAGLIELLGVVRFAVDRRAKKLNREATDWLEENLEGQLTVLESTIRDTTKAQVEAKTLGLTAGEYSALAKSADVEPWYKAVKEGRQAVTFAANADGLAEDYRDLADEVNKLIEDRGVR